MWKLFIKWTIIRAQVQSAWLTVIQVSCNIIGLGWWAFLYSRCLWWGLTAFTWLVDLWAHLLLMASAPEYTHNTQVYNMKPWRRSRRLMRNQWNKQRKSLIT